MKLNEWKDSNGKKVSIASSTPTPSTSTKNNVDQTDRYKSLVAQIDADGISTYTLNDLNATELNITVNRPNNKTLDIKIIYDPATDTYTLGMLGRELKGCDYKEDILELLVIGKIIKDTNLCESALKEFVDKNGKKVNLNNSAAQATNNTSTKNYPDQTNNYKKLLAQIDSDGFCKYTINILDDRILAITLNNGVGVKIIFKPYIPCYLVQVDGYDKNCDTFEDVLKHLIIEGIIVDTDLCEWLDSKGNKINSNSPSSSAQTGKTNKDKFISLLYYIMRNRGSQVLDSKVLGLNDTGFTYREMRRLPTGQEELIIVVNFYDDHWQMSVYKNGKFVDNYSGSSWETLLEALEGYYNVPTAGTKEYEKLCESTSFVDDFRTYEDMWN